MCLFLLLKLRFSIISLALLRRIDHPQTISPLLILVIKSTLEMKNYRSFCSPYYSSSWTILRYPVQQTSIIRIFLLFIKLVQSQVTSKSDLYQLYVQSSHFCLYSAQLTFIKNFENTFKCSYLELIF